MRALTPARSATNNTDTTAPVLIVSSVIESMEASTTVAKAVAKVTNELTIYLLRVLFIIYYTLIECLYKYSKIYTVLVFTPVDNPCLHFSHRRLGVQVMSVHFLSNK